MDISEELSKVDLLAKEIVEKIPSVPGNLEFRADLAGLLIVRMASSYENCVKETIFNYSEKKHISFGVFARNNFDKLNSRINMHDLNNYTKICDTSIHQKFKNSVKNQKQKFLDFNGNNIESSYEQILNWRHSFAHAGRREVTVEEAIFHHKYAKRVIFCFNSAFD